MNRRPRVVKEEDCPKCGSKIGETCRSYKGKGCAPHALDVPTALEQAEALAPPKKRREGKPLEQGWLF